MIGSGDVDFKMSIESIGGDYESGSCDASASGTGEISCVAEDSPGVNFKVDEDKHYLVCIKTKDSDDNKKYEINSEEVEPVCGFFGNFDEYDVDYDEESIGALRLSFDSRLDSGKKMFATLFRSC